MSNSSDGRPIFATSGLVPGHSAEGRMTVANDGTDPGALSVAEANLVDVPGPNGGPLSPRLRLRIEDVTAGSNLVVYDGAFDGPADRGLPVLVPGDERTYRFVAKLPDGGVPHGMTSGDNAFQGSSARVSYNWTLSTADATACKSSFRDDNAGDRVVGTQAGDRITGHGGADSLGGRRGADCIVGGPGADTIKGNAGADRLRGGGGRDRLHGGLGRDLIVARDGTRDIVRCGPGRDRAIVEPLDSVRGCEVVERSKSARP
jgi:hypothetical protein